MASVTKRKWMHNGTERTAWVIRYTDKSGSRKQETFEQKKQADRRRVEIEGELSRGVHVAVSDSCTVRQLADAYMQDVERRHHIGDRMTMTSVKSYRNMIYNHICVEFGTLKVVDLTPAMIQDWLNSKCETWKRSSVRRAHCNFTLLLSFAVSKRLAGRNVIKESRVRVPMGEVKRVAVPNRAQLAALLEALETRGTAERHRSVPIRRAAITLAMFCGLRRGEVCGLQWDNVDFGERLVRVRHNMSVHDGLKAPKTFAGIRDVPMPDPVFQALTILHEASGKPELGHVITAHSGRAMYPAELWEYYRDLCRRAGLADDGGKPLFHLHALRHAAASLAIAKGLSPLHVKTFIGHARVATTMDIYGHLFPDDERIAMALKSVAADFAPQQQ